MRAKIIEVVAPQVQTRAAKLQQLLVRLFKVLNPN